MLKARSVTRYRGDLPVMYNNLSISEKRSVRERYVEEQGGLCWYCKKSLKKGPSKEVVSKTIRKELFPENFFKYPVHLHHSHKDGLTIGAVHSRCNACLWQYLGE